MREGHSQCTVYAQWEKQKSKKKNVRGRDNGQKAGDSRAINTNRKRPAIGKYPCPPIFIGFAKPSGGVARMLNSASPPGFQPPYSKEAVR